MQVKSQISYASPKEKLFYDPNSILIIISSNDHAGNNISCNSLALFKSDLKNRKTLYTGQPKPHGRHLFPVGTN